MALEKAMYIGEKLQWFAKKDVDQCKQMQLLVALGAERVCCADL